MGDALDLLTRQIVESVQNDDDDEVAVTMAAALLLARQKRKRNPKVRHPRINLAEHFSRVQANTDFDFQRRYHMPEEAFWKLVELLQDKLKVDTRQSMRSTSGNRPILPEDIVAAGLRFLGGSTFLEVADIFGISYQSAHRVIHKFLNAVVEHPALEIDMPKTEEEFKKHADGWNKVSQAFGVFYGVVGAIDGLLIHTNKPAKDEVSNQADFYNGHYMRFGLNIQAVCDAKCRFIYFCVSSPGKTNDARAFSRCEGLTKAIDNFPEPYFLIGDNAYPLSKTMLIPYNAADGMTEDRRTYNFFLSQQRIRIEMTFGRFTSKWGIFKSNLRFDLETSSKICEAAARLYNFSIDNGARNSEDEPDNDREEEDDDGDEESTSENIPTYDYYSNDNGRRRKAIIAKIIELGLERPDENIERNAAEGFH